MKVKRKKRVLVVVANLTTHGREEYRWLYKWLDANAVAVPNLMLLTRYRRIEELVGKNATAAKFVKTLGRHGPGSAHGCH